MAFKVSPYFSNSVAETYGGLFGTDFGTSGGTLRLYTGTQPGTGGDGTAGCTLVAEFPSMIWSPATSGTAALASTAHVATAGTSGTVTWARLTPPAAAGTAICIDADCGTSATKGFVLDIEAINSGDVITLTGANFVGPSST